MCTQVGNTFVGRYVGPNLGAINRAALVGLSHVAMLVASDLFSLQGLKSLGPILRLWRTAREDGRGHRGNTFGVQIPVGYVLMQHAERLGHPTKAMPNGKVSCELPIANGCWASSRLFTGLGPTPTGSSA